MTNRLNRINALIKRTEQRIAQGDRPASVSVSRGRFVVSGELEVHLNHLKGERARLVEG